MATIRAVFENGVFRPHDKVDLPERCQVEFEPKIVELPDASQDALSEIYAILSRSYETGEPDIAERHNEHQP